MHYDYVIVGGGTAGCVLAARLSEDPAARVLLLEAGGAEPGGVGGDPAGWPQLVGSDADWGGLTVPQAAAGRVAYPRGRVLGGSGAINAMAHIRGHQGVYDAWADGGADGWGYSDLLPYFKRSEDTGKERDPELRGTHGSVRVAPVPEASRHPVAQAFATALCALGYEVTGDLSGHRQEGVAWPDLAIAGGHRVSPASAYLRPALNRPNLTVRTGSLVTRLMIEGSLCVGAVYVCDDAVELAHAAAEVVLCAGAVGSPQLLMLSGIGPAEHLSALGIGVTADLPAVGSNLQDHPVVTASYASAAPMRASSYNHGETYAAISSPQAGDWPDLQLFPILLPVVPPGRETPDVRFALAASVVAPASRGTVRLASASPDAAPLIDPGFLTASADLDRLEAGLGIIRRAAASKAMSELGFWEAWPGLDTRDGDGLRTWARSAVGSYYHPAGTCRIGPATDPGSVVNSQLQIQGMTGLRVADASVMPVIPNAPLHATVLAIAEKAADLISAPS